MYADGDGEVFIASSAGVRGSYRANQCYAFAYVLAEQDGQVETGYSYTRRPRARGARPGRLRRARPPSAPAGCSAPASAPR